MSFEADIRTSTAIPAPHDPSFVEWFVRFLVWMRAFFAEGLKDIRLFRRQRRVTAEHFSTYFDELAAAEWSVAHLVAEGVRRLLAGRPLDLWTIPNGGEPPAHWHAPPLRSADIMAQRLEVVARIMADPEAYIRRIADRILRGPREPLPPLGADVILPTSPIDTTLAADTS